MDNLPKNTDLIPPNPQIEVNSLRPFTQFCLSIGAIPSSYKTALTYEEQLLWLCDFLENTVIPTVNQNGLAVSELQELYEELGNYVDNYFTNLDVQEEINKKLDEMATNGDLDNIFQPYLEDYKNQINEIIEEQNTKINSATSGSPSGVYNTLQDLTNANPDHSKIYLVVANGNWYYYSNNSWVAGGVYQATELGNNSVTILNLDETLQDLFSIHYSEDIEKTNFLTGYYTPDYPDTTVPRFVSNEDYMSYRIDLEANETYQFNGFNNYQASGLLIVDNNGHIAFNSNVPIATNIYVPTNYIFRINQSGYKAYISRYKNISDNRLYVRYSLNSVRLRKIESISNLFVIDNSVTLLETLNDCYANWSNLNTTFFIAPNYSGATTKIFSIEKNKKYRVNGYNHFAQAGLLLTDNDYIAKYSSSSQSVSEAEQFNYEFVAEENGFAILSQLSDNEPATIEEITFDINLLNPLSYKKLGADGDSLIANTSSLAGFKTGVEQIADNNNMTLQDLAVGGGTIATGTTSNGNNRHWICQSVLNLNTDNDYILVGGGVNDYWNNVPLGAISQDFTSEIDSTTFFGGLETLCRNLLNRFNQGQKIGFIVYHKINNIFTTTNSLNLTYKDYYNAILEVMDKYSIPVINLAKTSCFNTAFDYYKNYTLNNNDGVHPSTQGYKLFYVNKITAFMKTL